MAMNGKSSFIFPVSTNILSFWTFLYQHLFFFTRKTILKYLIALIENWKQRNFQFENTNLCSKAKLNVRSFFKFLFFLLNSERKSSIYLFLKKRLYLSIKEFMKNFNFFSFVVSYENRGSFLFLFFKLF